LSFGIPPTRTTGPQPRWRPFGVPDKEHIPETHTISWLDGFRCQRNPSSRHNSTLPESA
jgi:hypothetical protein